MNYYLAIDIGASSGRHIVGWMEDGNIKTEEVFRFPNGVKEQDGHLVWDTDALDAYVREGIDKALERFGAIRSLSVDTWGVDYVLMNGDSEIGPCIAYRDLRTEAVIPKVHGIIPFEKLYGRTGIAFQNFNTIYQLYSDKLAGRLEQATDFIMMPAYIMYRLTGVKAHEYTDATTSGLLNAATGGFDLEITDALGLPRRLFGEVLQPGTVLGEYKGIKVVLCATHDTASAVEGIPMTGDGPYISSGTWSLLGVKSKRPVITSSGREHGWSNEGGVGYVRYQKNIMGMWLINRLRDELCPGRDFGDIVKGAQESAFDGTVDANDASLFSPDSMKAAFDALLGRSLESPDDYFRCAYASLAKCYADSVRELSENTGVQYDSICIVGGGAKNAFLNRLTQEASGLRVDAIPIEATAIGNLLVQMKSDR